MPELSVDYKECIEEYGAPYGGFAASSDQIATYRSFLPSTFVDFIETYGFGKWKKGYFQFCDHQAYRGVVDTVLKGDEDLQPSSSHLLGFSAFGQLLLWNEQHRVVNVDTIDHRVTCPKLFRPKPHVSADATLGIAISDIDSEAYDPSDNDGRPLFKRVLKSCGELEFGQIYALKLHPALGGPVTMENFRPAQALAALTIAVQAAPFTLYDSTQPHVPEVRVIGDR